MLDSTQLVITFLAFAHMWDGDVPCICTHVGCYTTGLGWGGDDDVPGTCIHVDATQRVYGSLKWFLHVFATLDELFRIW